MPHQPRMPHVRLVQVVLAAGLLFASTTISTSALPQTNMPNGEASPKKDTRPANCRVTLPSDGRFTPPAPYPAEPDGRGVLSFWFGNEKLWTDLPAEGTWQGLRPYSTSETSLRQKLFWWRAGYNWLAEQEPPLKVSGRRLDGNSPPFETSGYASNGYREQDWKSFTVIGIDIPTPGCWEITGQYKEQELSYVVWVTAAQPAVAASTANAKAPSVPAVAADVPPPNMSVELHDTTSGVSWKAPPGWHFAPIQRWGDHQSTVRIMGAEWPKIRPTLYYRIFENPQEMSPRVISRQLLRQINGKVRQRKEDGFQNYRVREGSAEQLLVNGNSAVRWVADYAESGDDMSEYLVRVRTDHTNALFYAFMPAKELDSFRQRFDPIIETLEIP